MGILLAVSFKMQLLIGGVFIFLVWFFVLRKYNSLGLRLFFLFSMAAGAVCYWLYLDIQDNNSMKAHGRAVSGRVIDKNKVSSESGSTQDNQITVAFALDGQSHTEKTSAYVSVEEYDALQKGQQIDLLYNPVNRQTYYVVSFNRYLSEQWFLYAFPAFLFLVGAISGLVFRRYKVGIHADTGDEYLEKDGQIILDEKGNKTARTLKHINIASKMLQAFK